jgi:hypothetical protein
MCGGIEVERRIGKEDLQRFRRVEVGGRESLRSRGHRRVKVYWLAGAVEGSGPTQCTDSFAGGNFLSRLIWCTDTGISTVPAGLMPAVGVMIMGPRLIFL